jgi:hypothetical protein
MQTFELTQDTPARILGVPVTICAGVRLETVSRDGRAQPELAGGVEVCTCWVPSDGGPAALAPFTIAAEHLRKQGIRVRRTVPSVELYLRGSVG